MNFLRKILFPLALLYDGITAFRNFLYDKGIFRSYGFDLPVIAVGNLSVGGTGKTPQIEYLIRLLSDTGRIATLSRGYKRKTKGFVMGAPGKNADDLGDEPYQFYKKFPDICVAVDADRRHGIEKLLHEPLPPDVILLDDAFQHRRVKAGMYILLTAYDELFYKDFVLPAGNLRESRRGCRRAHCIVVTKCPPDLNEESRNRIRECIRKWTDRPVFFTAIGYADSVRGGEKELSLTEVRKTPRMLIAGIAKPTPFFDYLGDDSTLCLRYPDHHHFTDQDILEISEKATGRLILTTEKDFVRLQGKLPGEQILYIPIQTVFIEGKEQFDQMIHNYVGTSTGKRRIYSEAN